jgi:hypothetical protein
MNININTQDTEVKDVEGTVEAEIKKDEQIATVESKKPDTVPLAVYLELKEDLKTLKQEIKESKDSNKSRVASEGVSDLAKKYPDVNEDFINDILSSATTKATKEIEAKYTPIIERQENEKKQLAFDRAFDNLFDKAVMDNPDLPKSVDKELVKELAITPKYRNVPVAEILVKMYGSVQEGKISSENESRVNGNRVEDIVDFNNITADQRTTIMADEKSRTKYFNWLDTQTGR